MTAVLVRGDCASVRALWLRGGGSDSAWIEAVVDAIRREVGTGTCRSMLLVKRAGGWMFHASRSANPDSIRAPRP